MNFAVYSKNRLSFCYAKIRIHVSNLAVFVLKEKKLLYFLHPQHPPRMRIHNTILKIEKIKYKTQRYDEVN